MATTLAGLLLPVLLGAAMLLGWIYLTQDRLHPGNNCSSRLVWI